MVTVMEDELMFKTEQSRETAAPSRAIGSLLMDVKAWPSWNPGYAAAELDEPVEVGDKGTVTLSNGRKRPFTIFECDESTSLVYGSDEFGGRIRFMNRIEPVSGGRCRVTLAATIDGFLSPVYGRLFGGIIAGYLPTAIEQLVAKAEAGS